MDHEIFFKSFDGPQKNIFCAFFLFNFFLFNFLFFFITSFNKLWGSKHKIFKLAIKRTLKKIRHFKKQVKSTWLYDNFSRKKKKLICFDPVAAVSFIMMGQRIYTFIRNFLEDSLSSSSISSEIV